MIQTPVLREADNLVAKVRKRYASSQSSLWNKAIRGHSRQAIRLETPGVIVLIDDKVDPTVVPKPQRSMNLHSQTLQAASKILRDVSGEDLLREPRLILAFVCLLYTSPSPRDRG